ncbi:hypothetical protein NXB81_004400, partial [Salmonella enterica]|nr:hypothetical protein [Salmonella enterica]
MHTFANLMYDVYQSFGLFRKGDRRAEIRAFANFSEHQRFFGNRDCEKYTEEKRYDEIIEILDAEKVFSTDQRREIFYKYEQLYNALMAHPVFTELSRKQIQKRYTLHILPRLIALDIYKTYKAENENSFYHHIHLFLQKDYCPCREDRKKGTYSAVRQYLKEYIKGFKIPHTENLLPVLKVIESIREEYSQKTGVLDAPAIVCLEAYTSIVNKEELKTISANLEQIKKAHNSLNVLLNLERHFPVINILSKYYRVYVENGIRPRNISDVLCRFLYEPEHGDIFLHDAMINSIVNYYYERAIKPVSLNVNSEYLQSVDSVKDIVFNFNEKTIISVTGLTDIAVRLKKESDNESLKPYLDLFMVIQSISKGDTDKAYEVVKCVNPDNLPAGYLMSAFLVLYIALRIKIERKSIRNDVFSSYITKLLENQGNYTDFMLASPAYMENDSNNISTNYVTFSASKFHKTSILSDTNNITIMRTVRMYNNMVRRISSWNDIEPDGVYPESIYGLLDKVEMILGKILKIIDDEKITSSQDLALILQKKRVLTKRELNDNLIGILVNCPLLKCVQDLENLIKY